MARDLPRRRGAAGGLHRRPRGAGCSGKSVARV